ncbi:FliG C-terminal domain-containing protein [Oscillospiraceae bacterium PP1C4]
MDNMEYLSSRLQCSREDKSECMETVKKLYGLAILARKEGFLALPDAVESEGLFLKTMVDTFLDVAEPKPLEAIFFSYLVAGDYRGKEFLKNLLIVNALLLIARQATPFDVVSGLQGWFGVEFSPTYKDEIAVETARLHPPVPIGQSVVPEFDRFAKLSKVHTIKLLSEVENNILAIALKGASDRVADRFFHLMDNKQEEEVRTAINALYNVRLKDVEEAQRYILGKATKKEAPYHGNA